MADKAMADNGRVIGASWGMTDCETLRSYPCDNLVASPVLQAWRSVDVRAPPEAVWPWVAQVRAAPCSSTRSTTSADAPPRSCWTSRSPGRGKVRHRQQA